MPRWPNPRGVLVSRFKRHLRAAHPDGQIYRLNGQGETNYQPLDRPGPWKMTDIGSNFTADLHDEARHGADWLKVYVPKQSSNLSKS
ncbi:lytic polysaccharide monooxygenase [Streptomyces sp. NPDC058534]|uniref:lytic polysaccharide monooxygenase n=1 Tax=Streptomyces sp. NPDC058534 TaxID=3346541 RepID=UPI0036670458